jgi:hypothetical protein
VCPPKLNRDLRPDLHDPVSWKLKVAARVIGILGKENEQLVLPMRHTGTSGWTHSSAGQEKSRGHDVEAQALLPSRQKLKSAGEDLPELRQIARRVIDCALNDEQNWSWAVKEIWDRLDGKPQQTVEATTVNEKRSALDWTTDELVAWLNEHAEKSGGVSAAKEADREPGIH